MPCVWATDAVYVVVWRKSQVLDHLLYYVCPRQSETRTALLAHARGTESVGAQVTKWDHTALACLDRCESEFYYRHVRHLAPPTPDASAHFGQIVHIGVRALYDGHSVAEAHEVMRKQWEDGVGTGGAGNAKPHLTLDRAHAIVHKYADQWMGAERMFDCVWNEGYAESETECALPDRCVRSHADGQLYAMDLKTTGLYLTPDWQRQFEHSQQAAMQLDVLEATLSEPLAGFWLDAVHIRRSGLPAADDFVRYGPLRYSAALRAELREQRTRKALRANDLRRFATQYPEMPAKSTGACVG